MEKTLKEIADAVSGEIVGDPSLKIKNVSNIEDASDGHLIFVLDKKLVEKLKASKASAVIVPKDIKGIKKPHIKVSDPKLSLAKVLKLFEPKKDYPRSIHMTTVIDPSAKISKSASIMAHVTIGKNTVIGDNVVVFPGCYIGDDCEIGKDSMIHSNASVYDRSLIGKRCIVHSGVVIGSDGYGFAPDGDKWEKIPQLGNVIIEDDVELFANTAIARGTLGSTIIKKGTKIDNLVHIAHNCVIGENGAITALIAVAGSTNVGKHVIMAGMCGISDHVNIGDNTVIMAKAGVVKDVPANSVVSGFPSRDHKEQMEIQAIVNQLPKVVKRIKYLEDKQK